MIIDAIDLQAKHAMMSMPVTSVLIRVASLHTTAFWWLAYLRKDYMQKTQITVRLPDTIVNRVKNYVYWTPGLTFQAFVEAAISSQLGQVERERGEPYPSRKPKK